MLSCSGCGENKPKGEFSPQPSNKNRGHAAYCKPCLAAYARERYAKNREAGAERMRTQRKNPGVKARIAEYNKTYRLENRELVRRLDNDPAKRERDRARRKTPEGRRLSVLSTQRRRAALLRGSGVSAEQWESRLREFNFCCAYCLMPGEMTLDHMTPLSHGGEHSLENVIPACGSCNSRKNTKNILEFLSIS